ncbi:transcription antitermination factor NusB [Pseudoroseomonas cervicalis]|uniref:Transcription antitermination protein NusB n=1 Tax=Pseudoroseomonas cervicalis ATCC 49957 TaxID=525371 RepID=D5RJ02_9PROT|nr:transcription antitermination factor NusB [Pseudoroseomonas cervicalis]EFH12714.1 transcription antitermination factor NusB [Pseudoroseomonas cervicalis ATCC 49957]
MSGAPGSPVGKKPRPPVAGRPRTGSRVAAIQALFQSEQSGESAETVIDQFVRFRIGPDAGGFEDGRVPLADVPLFAGVVRGVARQSEALDGILQGHLAGDWTVARLDPVLRALLRAAAHELSSGTEPPARVVINEYMDIAHGFFSGEEPRFANGVLDAMARSLRAPEFQR